MFQKYKTDPNEEMNEVSKFSDSFMNTEKYLNSNKYVRVMLASYFR